MRAPVLTQNMRLSSQGLALLCQFMSSDVLVLRLSTDFRHKRSAILGFVGTNKRRDGVDQSGTEASTISAVRTRTESCYNVLYMRLRLI